jgi:hypothetical protein
MPFLTIMPILPHYTEMALEIVAELNGLLFCAFFYGFFTVVFSQSCVSLLKYGFSSFLSYSFVRESMTFPVIFKILMGNFYVPLEIL